MSSNRSRVTALVPAYQAADFIQPTLDSLSAQTYDNFDVLISVDVCDDDTYDICTQHSHHDSRFRVVRQTENRLGYVGNCNFLMQHADADYVMLAFHDDTLAPTFTEKLCAVLDARPEVVLSFCDVRFTNVDGQEELWDYTLLEGVDSRIERGWRLLQRAHKWWVPNRGLFRLARSRRIGGLKRHGAGEFSPDWPWLFHMSLLGEFARVPEVLCHKIRKPGSLSRSWQFSKPQWLEATSSCMRELWLSELTTPEKLALSQPLQQYMQKTLRELQSRPPENEGADAVR